MQESGSGSGVEGSGGSGDAYAATRRKKPVQNKAKHRSENTKAVRRHRDCVNIEMAHLTSLLPFSEELRGRLDQTSVLRLGVGYIKVKSHLHDLLQKNARRDLLPSSAGTGQTVSLDGVSLSEGEFLLQALNGFLLVVMADGTIFYASPSIQDFLGYSQYDVIHHSVYELIHADDQEMLRSQLHFARDPCDKDSDTGAEGACCDALTISRILSPRYIPPENSPFLERSFCCRLHCHFDISGFLALNFRGRLKYLHVQGGVSTDGTVAPPQLALFTVATPVPPPSVMEIRTKTFLFQTKHRLDFAPMGIDARGKLVLGYTETELFTTGSGYQFIHAADMMHCADNHLRMMKTGDSGFTVFRLLTKARRWLWVKASAWVVFKGGRPDFIISLQKPLTNEEGDEHLRQRRLPPFSMATSEGVLYDISSDAAASCLGACASNAAEPATEQPLDPASLLGCLRQQDPSVYTEPQETSPQHKVFSHTEDPDFDHLQSSLEQAFRDDHSLLGTPGQIQASVKRSIMGDISLETMADSLEEILKELRDEGLEGLDVEEAELRDWENTLVGMNKGRENASMEPDHMLANDVFSYVEEALKTEFGGFVQTSDQLFVLETADSLSIQGQHLEQTHLGNSLGAGVSHRAGQTQCLNTHQGNTTFQPSSSSNHPCGNTDISTQTQTALLSLQITECMYSDQSGSEVTSTEWTRMGPQQPLQSFHRHSFTSSSRTALLSHTQTRQLSGSRTNERRHSHVPSTSTAPRRPAGTRELANTNPPPFTPSHPGRAATGVDSISSGPPTGHNTGLETTSSHSHAPECEPLESPFLRRKSKSLSNSVSQNSRCCSKTD